MAFDRERISFFFSPLCFALRYGRFSPDAHPNPCSETGKIAVESLFSEAKFYFVTPPITKSIENKLSNLFALYR